MRVGRKIGLDYRGLFMEVGSMGKRSIPIELLGVQLYHVPVRVHDVEPRPSARASGALFHPLELIVGLRMEALRKEEPSCLTIACDPKRKMDVLIVDRFALPEGGVVTRYQMKLAVAELIPGARCIGRRPLYLIQPQDIPVKCPRALQVRHRDADVMDGLDLDDLAPLLRPSIWQPPETVART